MKKSKLLTPAFLLLSLNLSISSATAAVNDGTSATTTDEVISVKGYYPVSHYRIKMQKEERQFYKIYNTLTANPEHRVVCPKSAARACVPKFKSMKMSEKLHGSRIATMKSQNGNPHNAVYAASVWSNETSSNPRYTDRVKENQAAVMDELSKLVNESPELQQQLVRFVEAKKAYEQRKAQGMF